MLRLAKLLNQKNANNAEIQRELKGLTLIIKNRFEFVGSVDLATLNGTGQIQRAEP